VSVKYTSIKRYQQVNIWADCLFSTTKISKLLKNDRSTRQDFFWKICSRKAFSRVCCELKIA